MVSVTGRGIGIVFVVLVVVACAVVGVWGEQLQSYWTSRDSEPVLPPGSVKHSLPHRHRTRHRTGSRGNTPGSHGHGSVGVKVTAHEEKKQKQTSTGLEGETEDCCGAAVLFWSVVLC